MLGRSRGSRFQPVEDCIRYFREELLDRPRHLLHRAGAARALRSSKSSAARRAWSGSCCPPATLSTSTGPRSISRSPRSSSRRPATSIFRPGQIAAMLGLMLLTSKGAAGVTGSGFVALVATLTVMPDLPVAGVAILVGDRSLHVGGARAHQHRSAIAWPASWCRSGRRRAIAHADARARRELRKDGAGADEGSLVDETLRERFGHVSRLIRNRRRFRP